MNPTISQYEKLKCQCTLSAERPKAIETLTEAESQLRYCLFTAISCRVSTTHSAAALMMPYSH